MNRVVTLAAGAAAVALCLSACGSSSSTTAANPPSSGSVAHGGGVATVKTADSPLGKILVDGSGRTLYLFKGDHGTTSTCNGACATAWPPLTTTRTPRSSGITAADLATTARSDHSTQVTYHGHPLYYFAEDSKAGQTKGQGVNAFGALWYVVGTNGDAITKSPSPSASSSSSGGSGGGY